MKPDLLEPLRAAYRAGIAACDAILADLRGEPPPQWGHLFPRLDAKIGETIRIRLPKDYTVRDTFPAVAKASKRWRSANTEPPFRAIAERVMAKQRLKRQSR